MAVLQNLEILNLSGNKLTGFRFERFSRLKILDLSFHAIQTGEIHAPHLVELSIQNKNVKTLRVFNISSITHFHINSNDLTDISIVERIPTLTHLTASSSPFIHNWESFAIAALPGLTMIHGLILRDGEIAIHKDRVVRFIRSTRTQYPHRALSQISLDFRALRDVEPALMPASEEIETVWIGRSRERCDSAQLVLE
jgi:hypothetical protein